MLKGFKEFIARGSVVDLAVGVVMGAAFGSVVKQFTDSFLQPLITLVTGGQGVGGTFTINGVAFTYGAFISSVITFMLTAATIYFVVVLPMNKYAEFRRRDTDPIEVKLREEVQLLTDIRDELRQRDVVRQRDGVVARNG